MIRHSIAWYRLVLPVWAAAQALILSWAAAVHPVQAQGRSTPATAAADLQAQVRSTAAKVIPAVVRIASTVMVHDQAFSDE